jgi:hypothetical protein
VKMTCKTTCLILFLCLSIMLVHGCSRKPDASIPSPTPSPDNHQICVIPGKGLSEIVQLKSTTIDQMEKKFGKPDSIEPLEKTEKIFYHYHSSGLSFLFKKTGGRKIEGIRISKDIYATERGIRVGSPYGEVIRTFGPPDSPQRPNHPRIITYGKGINFVFENDRVKSMWLHQKR